MYELQQNDKCPYADECRNSDNEMECSCCENNPFNYVTMDKYGEGFVHTQKGRAYYRFRDKFEPI